MYEEHRSPSRLESVKSFIHREKKGKSKCLSGIMWQQKETVQDGEKKVWPSGSKKKKSPCADRPVEPAHTNLTPSMGNCNDIENISFKKFPKQIERSRTEPTKVIKGIGADNDMLGRRKWLYGVRRRISRTLERAVRTLRRGVYRFHPRQRCT